MERQVRQEHASDQYRHVQSPFCHMHSAGEADLFSHGCILYVAIFREATKELR